MSGQNLPTGPADPAGGRGAAPWVDELTALPSLAMLARWLDSHTGPRA
ncbi:MAG: hypothetical protein HOV87_20355, partial [Catenulispora sp.]|nr:hypothetical protein [Catenulispora sp.]